MDKNWFIIILGDNMSEFDDQIKFEDDSIEEFKIQSRDGFIGPALLSLLTGSIGSLVISIILMHQ